jgi:LPPG:FO 2-phospho-L-lactate transferase
VTSTRIAVLCGGVGGSRFVRALASVFDPKDITAIVNTGDDDDFHSLYVSPDPDIVTYALAGEVDEERGWGLRGDTFRWIEHMSRLGHDTWFRIGDSDLATHIHRTRMMEEGAPLSETMASIARVYDIDVKLLPMSDDKVRTVVETDSGDLPFQRYLVERRALDRVEGVRFDGAAVARPAPGVIEAVTDAEAIFLAPSNPVASIAPILAIPGIREAVERQAAPCVAVSPIIGGRSLQPPTGEMLLGIGYEVNAVGVARFYAPLIGSLVIDEADRHLANRIEALGIVPVVTNTLMRDGASSKHLGRTALKAAGILPE